MEGLGDGRCSNCCLTSTRTSALPPSSPQRAPRTQYALSEAAAAQSLHQGQRCQGTEELWTFVGKGCGKGTWKLAVLIWQKTLYNHLPFLAYWGGEVVGQGGKKTF